jgi:hypothetical protein
MLPENFPIFIKKISADMPSIIYKSRFIIALLIATLLLATSCEKAKDTYVTNVLEQYFETNILNRDFIVNYASNDSIDITSQYNGWVFRLLKNTYYDGPMTATKNGTVITGTWTSNEDFGKLVINLTQPNIPSEFNFLNRQWRFTSKAIPIMKLAPWGTTDPKVVHMQRL